ncbi:hypothetical protein [Rhodothermus marinus]|uniref:hypothetical protein n=1 Tax=Rhodothermus marinus TaxID=29549 RepID=UPI0012BA42CB|nr:hypothetical protein [Rhodothermus marinus]BBM69452.1 hypothetical protein RmaAA213_12980 [Rhodothermus marinus]BBM72434.1 hypothetical protein RmaAA338_12990 [Rhodothermus marinus]
MKPEATTPEPESRPQSRAEVEAALQAKAQEIEADLEALQEEVRQLGRSFREALWNHPLVSVGGSLVAGLLVGWVLGGLGRRRPRLSKTHRALVSAYLEALVAEARKAARRGRDPVQAIRKALEERVPLVIVQDNEGASEKGVLRSIGGAVLGLVGSAASVALSRVLADALLDAFAAGQQTEAVDAEIPEA